MHPYFNLPDCINFDPQHSKIEYSNPDNYPNWLIKYEELKKNILSNNKLIILRCFDGEWHYLNQNLSAIKRDTTLISKNTIDLYKTNIQNVDIFTSHLTHFDDRKVFNRDIDYPMEFVYSLVANKWLLKKFKNSISLVGGTHTISLIRKLMLYPEYREYIEQDFFNELIEIPSTKSCDNPNNIISSLSVLKNSKSKLILFGIGICKLSIIDKLQEIHNGIYIDIGHGLDCLAGIGNIQRPYFGLWKNYRIRNIDYNNVYRSDPDTEQGNKSIIYL